MLIWVLQSSHCFKIRLAQHCGRRGANISENEGVRSECKKFEENSRQMAPVSTICDEYCSSDKCAFSNSGNSVEGVTKKNVQEFSHVVSNPGEPVISPKSKMFKPQVSVTCQHECSQDCQPQDVPNENILIEIIKCLSQAITRCEHVLAGSLLKESKIVQSSNVPVFSPNRVIDYEKSLNDNVSQEVGESKEELAPEFKNENKLKVNDVEAKVVVSKTCHGLSVSSDPVSGSHVTDSVSLPVNSCRLDSIYPFKGDSFDISVTIEDFKFPALIDTGAAVTAISSQVWDQY